MNAFDATKTGTGDTGLANLFAATATPANGQGAGQAVQGTTPFAQLLDQLNALPVPQASGAPVAAVHAESAGVAPTALPAPLTVSELQMAPTQQNSPPVGELARMAIQADRAPLAASVRADALRLPVIGKTMPPVATAGTNLPVNVVAGAEADMVAAPPVSEKLEGHAGEGANLSPTPSTPPITAALQPVPVRTSAVLTRQGGADAIRADQRVTDRPTIPAAAAPAITATPATPAVTLTAADIPVTPAGERPAASDHMPRETASAAPARPAMPVTADLHASATVAEPMTLAPHSRPEPQQLAMQDLTQIVERLAAAREAATPAATQLAVEHAEFGSLSLSIQQGDRGELAIAVAAADRGSQAALVAAMGQSEAPGFEQAPERRGGEPAQRESAAAGQHNDQRGQGTQRDRFAGQQQRQSAPQREPAQERNGETRSGTYA